ncbi:DUF5672 family protein [Spirosoma rigui]|uniref:DUF5672 family protein n=1 Tax=Spirosoma rigui TaxID=564064 RepID=UPI001FE4AC44|nr:DUF5672 family protein [Spirosoma rigui]
MYNQVAIIIPVYRPEPDETEKMSLRQCLSVLGGYPIIFFCGHSFNCSAYERFASDHGVVYQKRTFPDGFFTSKETYNALCLQKAFYTAFADYEFILIYQLDAWVFRDELASWCAKAYDYIGAPYPTDFDAPLDEVVFSTVGNGGFSLRRTKPIINLLSTYRRMKNWSELLDAYAPRTRQNPLFYLYVLIRYAGYRNTISYLKKGKWEDNFFSEVGRLTSYLRIPKAEEALMFSFEYKPSAAFAQNKGQLPFGCHGWTWIEYETFWHHHIGEIAH